MCIRLIWVKLCEANLLILIRVCIYRVSSRGYSMLHVQYYVGVEKGIQWEFHLWSIHMKKGFVPSSFVQINFKRSPPPPKGSLQEEFISTRFTFYPPSIHMFSSLKQCLSYNVWCFYNFVNKIWSISPYKNLLVLSFNILYKSWGDFL